MYRKIVHFTNDEFDIQRVKQIEKYVRHRFKSITYKFLEFNIILDRKLVYQYVIFLFKSNPTKAQGHAFYLIFLTNEIIIWNYFNEKDRTKKSSKIHIVVCLYHYKLKSNSILRHDQIRTYVWITFEKRNCLWTYKMISFA